MLITLFSGIKNPEKWCKQKYAGTVLYLTVAIGAEMDFGERHDLDP